MYNAIMISEMIQQFCSAYPDISSQQFKYNSTSRLITHEIPDALHKAINLNAEEYLIKGSVGQGRWSDIPWLAIMHRGITTSTQHGYYIALLFSKDLKSIYITTGLGWTQFAEKYGNKIGRKEIRNKADGIASFLSIYQDDVTGTIALGATSDRGKGYEVSNIVSSTASVAGLIDDELVALLLRQLKYYEQLREEYGADIFYDYDHEGLPGYEDVKKFQKTVRQQSSSINKSRAILKLLSIAEAQPLAKRKVYTNQIIRNRAFADYVKVRANYICEICGRKPFIQRNGQFFAEADHVDPLFAQGIDHPDNMRSLCALCHRIITYGSEEEVKKIMSMSTSQ